MQRNRGFTLVEILVVVGILTILAAVLFPVVARVREKGRQATCQSNLQQIHKAMMLYIQDHDSKIAPAFGYWEIMAAYTKNSAIFSCPSTPQPPLNTDAKPDFYKGAYRLYVGFIHNYVLLNPGVASSQRVVGVNESVLADASKIFVHSDQAFYEFFREVSMPRADACGMTLGNGTPDVLQTASTIHNGGANSLFFDGHVKWMTPEQYVVAMCAAAKYLQPPFRADGERL